jgi:hypothetical protein
MDWPLVAAFVAALAASAQALWVSPLLKKKTINFFAPVALVYAIGLTVWVREI